MAPLTAVAISGGVDSMMAAFLLKQEGQDVVGLHFHHGFEMPDGHVKPHDAPLSSDPNDKTAAILSIGKQLDIPIKIVDLEKPFREKVVHYFAHAYASGQTPNPCLVCNPRIKFGELLDHAEKMGARALATGHYARKIKDPNGQCHLLKGKDNQKDQSYFLAFLNQTQLNRGRFPLGGMQKEDVKRLAGEQDLRPLTHNESQDVCFIPGGNYTRFLEKQEGLQARPGLIVNGKGDIVGEHKGLHCFTIGQRRGINCPAEKPYYVIRMDIKRNRLVVGFLDDIRTDQCQVAQINWIVDPPHKPMEIQAKIRYRSPSFSAILIPTNRQTAQLQFDRPQKAVTPGQGAVFYQGDEVLGGGFITQPKNEP